MNKKIEICESKGGVCPQQKAGSVPVESGVCPQQKAGSVPVEKAGSVPVESGACPQLDDLHDPEYAAPLKEAALLIVEQNYALIDRARAADFNPLKELEYSSNGAMGRIHNFFECLAKYAEGSVPGWVVQDMVSSTSRLICVLEGLKDAPIGQLDAAQVAFNKASIFWDSTYAEPKMRHEVYLKKVFEAEKVITTALEILHAKYVEISCEKKPKGGKRRMVAAEMDSQTAKRKDDQRRVFQNITILCQEKGISVRAAVKRMRTNEVWRVRLGKKKDESWAHDYYARKRVAEKRSEVTEEATEKRPEVTERVTENGMEVTEKVTERRSEDTEKVTEEGAVAGTEHKIMRMLAANPCITQEVLAGELCLSRPYVARVMGRLRRQGVIRRIGSDRGGHWQIM